MNHLNICRAFDAVRPSDELKQSILNMTEEGKPTPKRSSKHILYRAAALAAALAIILTAALWPRETDDGFVTAPGVLKVYAYDLSTGTEVKNMVTNVMEEGVGYLPSIWSPYLSSAGLGLPISFEIADDYYADKKITFDISLNCGECCQYSKDGHKMDMGSEFTVDNKDKIYWCGAWPDEAKAVIEKDGGIYADVIVRADGEIVGYAMLEIGYAEEPYVMMFPVRCETVCFPMVDGTLQDVSEEYVREQIAVYKSEVSSYSGAEKLAEYREYISQIFGGEKSEN